MAKPLTLLDRFDRLNRRHFKGKLKGSVMVRFAKQPHPDSPTVVGHTIMWKDGGACILIHEALKPFDTLVSLVLVHEAVHIWNDQRGISSKADDCTKKGSPHHRKMLSILSKEPTLC